MTRRIRVIYESSQGILRPKSVNRRTLPFPVEALSLYVPRRARGSSGALHHHPSQCLQELKHRQTSSSIKFWANILGEHVEQSHDQSWRLCAVPGSSPAQTSGVARVVSAVCKNLGRIDATEAVTRFQAIPRSSLRNRFDITIHLQSLDVIGDLKGCKVLLIDDWVQSGTTLLAMHECLKGAGVSGIKGIVLAEAGAWQ